MNLWKNVHIDPELREFIVLSPKDVHDLSIKATQQPDPDTWLAEELERRGREKRDNMQAQNAARRARDAEFINDQGRWPSAILCLKTQPWMNEKSSPRFALIHAFNPLMVIEGHKPIVVFENVDALVEVWSVD